MSWAFPTTLFRSNTVYDYLDVNEQLLEFSSQIDGWLNEHNFVVTIGSDLYADTKLATNVAVRAFRTATARNGIGGGSAVWSVPHSESWSTVSASTMTFGTPGGKCFITYSFQVNFTSQPAQSPGLQFCIDLDGSAQMSTLLGSGDMGNERFNDDNVTASTLPVSNSSPSIRHEYSAHCVEGLFTVDAGEHTAKLMVRNPYTLRDGARAGQGIGSLEGYILMLWA